MSVRVLALILGLCALAQAIPRPASVVAKRSLVPVAEHLEKRLALKVATPVKRAAVVLEKRWPKSVDNVEKRSIENHIYGVKRSLPTLSVQPSLTGYYQYEVPSTQTYYYYYVLPDGSIKYVQGAPQVQAQLPQVQISQPIAQESSSGGLLSFLQKPLTAAGNIIQKTGDVASGIINLPFDAGRQVVAGVGLDDTLVGKLATGILDVGEGIEQTKLSILSNVAQAPFRIGAKVAGALDEE